MSYSFSLETCLGVDHEQRSPLRFETQKEAVAYANKIFKPPQSVLSYQIVEVATKSNSRFLKGKLEFI